MGRVISVDTQEGGSTPALTETGKGGLFSTGYLRDDPAVEYVGDGETVAFVVTNADRGVVRERGEERTAITPGDGYRTIGVVTDRRIIVLVGDADDGDERVTLPLIEIADARTVDDDLVVEVGSGETWQVPAGKDGVQDVVAYVGRAVTTWDELERQLDAAKRELVAATADRDDGAYESAIESAQTAYDRVDDAATLVGELADVGPTGAMNERVEGVRDRYVQTVADVRLGHGRAIADDAEEHWRAREWEAAYDAYERARAEFEAVASLDADRHDETDGLEAGLERIERATGELAEAPLQRAIDADRRANVADAPDDAVAGWRTARERYLTSLGLDENEPERRFAGDAEKIQERVDTVTDRIVETATDEGVGALAAGNWYREADRPGVAREEALVAEAIFEDALAIAGDARPDVVEDLEEWLDDARGILEATTDAAGGDSTGEHDERGETEADDRMDDIEVVNVGDDAPTGENATDAPSIEDAIAAEPDEASPADAAVGLDERSAEARLAAVTDAERAAAADAGQPVVGDGAGDAVRASEPGAPIPVQLRALEPEGFDELACALVESMGWTPHAAPADAPYDIRAARSEPEGTVAVQTIHRPTAGPVDADQVEDATDLHDEVPAGDVMVVTSSGVTEAAVRAARHQSVRLIDRDYITTVLASGGPDDLLEQVRPRPSE